MKQKLYSINSKNFNFKICYTSKTSPDNEQINEHYKNTKLNSWFFLRQGIPNTFQKL